MTKRITELLMLHTYFSTHFRFLGQYAHLHNFKYNFITTMISDGRRKLGLSSYSLMMFCWENNQINRVTSIGIIIVHCFNRPSYRNMNTSSYGLTTGVLIYLRGLIVISVRPCVTVLTEVTMLTLYKSTRELY